MAGPWEKYQAAPPAAAAVPPAEAGPWTKYAAPAPAVGTIEGLGAGFVRGVRDVIDKPAQVLANAFSSKEGDRVAALNETGKSDFDKTYSDSTAADVGRIAGQVAIAAPAGAALGAGVRAAGVASAAPRVAALGRAIETGGLSADGAGLATRVAGGAIGGAATTALVDPNDAATGAAIGAALPAVVRGLGVAGFRAQQAMRGPEVPTGLRDAAAAGAESGLIVPPSMVKPTLVNRAVEGYAGKASVAQQASSRNQGFLNKIAREAIGAEDLTPEGLAAVRARANQAYDALGRAGTFTADDAFRGALEKVGASSKQLKADFPEVIHKDVEALVDSFAGKTAFDAQSAIEAIKRLRASANANKSAFSDPEKQALGRVQNKVSGALEDLIDRNLTAQGKPELLAGYRNARQTLARVYDVERATNPSTGTIDGRKLVAALKKGRLTGDLKKAAEFSAAFPKATQAVEQIGSQPGISPLDFGGAALGSAAFGPAAALHLVARPLARAAALSQTMQRGITKAPTVDGPRLGLSRPAESEVARLAAAGLPVGLTNRDR
ncbi:hypothetical protein C7T35_01510 [Variovorax sp. WS11]|uniref:hypothetical protein n=1 Tax=Variovorax sp. WS11 TaxID=1105204 RepID=UPI000D0CE8F8|nr:hypothetical protein [Variovorax sp. WS11]NDZ11470.1 hypothetical protein [Variovorax sp. WS11]PSL86671.1 hypothetical protein C7T35_01510 [Variovorax sp. WS11]